MRPGSGRTEHPGSRGEITSTLSPLGSLPHGAAPAAHRRERWLLAAILVIGFVVRVHDLAAQSLWGDEFLSLFASSGRVFSQSALPSGVVLEPPLPPPATSLEAAAPWWAIWWSTRGYSHPPLYFLLLRAWREAFGSGDTAVRSLSVVASMVALLLLFDVAQRLHGATTALLATALMAVAPPQVLYAQEARGYTLALALCLAAASAVVRIQQGGASPVRVAALGGFSLASVLTHYYAVGPVAGFVLYGVLRSPRRDRWRMAAALMVAAALFLATWGPVMWEQRERARSRPWIAAPEQTVGRLLARAASVPGLHVMATTIDTVDPSEAGVLVVVAALFSLRLRRRYLAWLLCLGATVATVACLDAVLSVRQLSMVRYTVAASPATYVLLAAPLPLSSHWVRYAVFVVAAGAAAFRLPEAYFPRKPPWRSLGAAVAHFVTPGSTLVIAGPKRSLDYAFLDSYVSLRRNRLVLVGESLPAVTAERLRRTEKLWVVAHGDDWRVQLGPERGAHLVGSFGSAPDLWLVGLGDGAAPRPAFAPATTGTGGGTSKASMVGMPGHSTLSAPMAEGAGGSPSR